MSTKQQRSRLRGRDDEGQALVIVMVLSVALIMMVAVAVSSAVANLGFSGSFGNTSQARLTALSGLSQATSAMAAASSAPFLPCGVPSTNMPFPQTGGGNDSYSVSIAYFSDPAATVPISCTGSGNTFGTGTVAPASAILTSTGTAAHTTPVVVQEKALVNAGGSLSAPFGFAMLSTGTLNLTTDLKVPGSSADIYGGTVNQCANDAAIGGSVQAASSATSNVTIGNACKISGNLYVNGSVTLGNSATVGGSVYAYGGSVTLKNSANVTGSVYASGGSVTLKNSAYVGTNVYAYGTSSTPGTIGIETGTSTAVSGSAYATGAINESSSANIAGSVNPDVSPANMPVLPAEPPNQTFPQLDPTVASLTSAGYFVYQLGGSSSLPCSDFAAYASPTTASPVAAAYTAKTAIYAPTCDVSLSGSNTLDLSSNMVWVVGGLTSSGSLTVGSTSTPPPDLSVVVPTGTSCPSGDLSFNGNAFSSSINVLLYTPCSVTLTGSQTLTGQILAGTDITTTGSFALTYNQLAAGQLPGTTGAATPVITVESKTAISG